MRPSGAPPVAPTLERRLSLRDAVVVGAGSMIGAGVFARGARCELPPAPGSSSAWSSPASSPSATQPHQPNWQPSTPSPAAPTSTPAVSSDRHGDTSPAGASSSARPPPASRSHSPRASTSGPNTPDSSASALCSLVAVVNVGGLTRTVAVTKCLLVVAIAALVVVIVAGWSSPGTSLSDISPIDTSATGVLRSAGFLFFAFAGYARIATLGEEVRDPATTIPKAIPRALFGVLLIYAVVGVTLLATVPVDAIATSDAPLDLVVEASRFDGLAPIVRIGAGIAALGVLLNLIPGISRTTLAMARRHELPSWLAHLDHRALPLRAEAVITVDRHHAHRHHRPQGSDRLLRSHDPHLLRHHQRRHVHPAHAPATLAPTTRDRRPRRLPHARGHAARRSDHHRNRRALTRSRHPPTDTRSPSDNSETRRMRPPSHHGSSSAGW